MRKSSIIVFFIFTLLLIYGPVYSGDDEFRKIIRDYLSVSTIKAEVTQHVYPEDGSVEVFSGDYYAAEKGLIRIDYIRPERQTVIVNGSALFWYYNDRKLLFTSKRKNDSSSVPVLINILPGDSIKNMQVVYLGKKFYSLFRAADVYSIRSVKNRGEMTIWIDPVLKTVKRKIIFDDSGREIMKEEYTDHAEVNGILIPSRIELKARTSSGIIHTVTEYRNLVINSRIDESLFSFKITGDMDVRELDVR